MDKRRKEIDPDPAFDEYVYTILYNATPADRDKLPLRFRKIMKSEKSVTRFITASSLETKINLLSYLGIKHGLFLVDDYSQSMKKLKDKLADIDKQKKAGLLQDISDNKLYVVTDREVIHRLTSLARLTHTESYLLNQQFQRVTYQVHNWSRKFNRTDGLDLPQIEADMSAVIKTVLQANMSIEFSTSIFGLSMNQIKVLLFLYLSREGYTPIEKLWDFFAIFLSKLKVTAAVKELFEERHIEKHGVSGNREYIITGKGIKMVNEFLNRVLQSNTF